MDVQTIFMARWHDMLLRNSGSYSLVHGGLMLARVMEKIGDSGLGLIHFKTVNCSIDDMKR